MEPTDPLAPAFLPCLIILSLGLLLTLVRPTQPHVRFIAAALTGTLLVWYPPAA